MLLGCRKCLLCTSRVWVCFMHADREGGWKNGREGRALLGNAEGTWAPGGSEWMTKFGLKGHTNIHLLPAIKRVTQWWRYRAPGASVRWHRSRQCGHGPNSLGTVRPQRDKESGWVLLELCSGKSAFFFLWFLFYHNILLLLSCYFFQYTYHLLLPLMKYWKLLEVWTPKITAKKGEVAGEICSIKLKKNVASNIFHWKLLTLWMKTVNY